MSQESKVIVITGASSGIGEAAARLLAKQGHHLVLGARRTERLEKLVNDLGNNALAVTCDVTKRADVDALIQSAVDQFGRVDVLVNNAGIMPLSFLAQGKVDEWENMIDTNIKGVLYGINAALPHMSAQKSGHVINISSVAGHIVTPSSSVYSATKFAVRAITEGLRQENRGFLRTTVICPGAIDTELPDIISDERIKAGIGKVYEEAVSTDSIAQAIAYAISQPEDVDVNELVIRPTKQKL